MVALTSKETDLKFIILHIVCCFLRFGAFLVYQKFLKIWYENLYFIFREIIWTFIFLEKTQTSNIGLSSELKHLFSRIERGRATNWLIFWASSELKHQNWIEMTDVHVSTKFFAATVCATIVKSEKSKLEAIH